MDIDRLIEFAAAVLVALLVTRYGHEEAARFLDRLAAHVRTAGKLLDVRR